MYRFQVECFVRFLGSVGWANRSLVHLVDVRADSVAEARDAARQRIDADSSIDKIEITPARVIELVNAQTA